VAWSRCNSDMPVGVGGSRPVHVPSPKMTKEQGLPWAVDSSSGMSLQNHCHETWERSICCGISNALGL
jgi:hypothetical protein